MKPAGPSRRIHDIAAQIPSTGKYYGHRFCGKCCEGLIIEASIRDAEREPRIKERGNPLWNSDIEIFEGRKEIGGYLLNSSGNGGACAFFDRQTRLCTIHETRPLVCRLFDCDQQQDRFGDQPSDESVTVRDEERG